VLCRKGLLAMAGGPRVQCDCVSKRCGLQNGIMVSRSTWFRHKAGDLLARKHPQEDERDKDDDDDGQEDQLYVPADEVDEDLLTQLEAAGLFGGPADAVHTYIYFGPHIYLFKFSPKTIPPLHGQLAHCKIF
jgi:hypothetical protein